MSRFQGWTVRSNLAAACVLMAATSLLSFATTAAAARADLKFAKPLTLPALDKEELIAAPLDSDVYAATRDGLPDVRILDAHDVEVPFVLRKAMSQKEETVRATWTAHRAPSAKPLPNDGLEITLELDREEPMPSGLRLVSPLVNFEQHARVEYSPDGNRWEPLVEDGLIFDYSRYIDVRQDTIAWTTPADARRSEPLAADAPLRRIRITIENVTQDQESQLMELTRRLRGGEDTERLTIERRPFRIERIEFLRDDVRPRVTGEQLEAYSLTAFEVTNDPDAKKTVITVDSRRDPLTELTVVSDARNFSRAAMVEIERSQGPGLAWRTIGSGRLSNIDFHNLDRANLTIPLTETRQPRYRLVIENRDSPPLEITGLKARGPIYELVFLAQPKTAYRLAYGGSNVDSPDYDTAAIATALGAGYVPQPAEAGAQDVLSSTAATGEPTFKRLINDSRLLTAAILVLVAVLGIGLYQASRRVNSQGG